MQEMTETVPEGYSILENRVIACTLPHASVDLDNNICKACTF